MARFMNAEQIADALLRLNRLTLALTVANTVLWAAAGVAIAFIK